MTKSAVVLLAFGCVLSLASSATAQVELPNSRPIPQLQVLPHAHDQTGIELNTRELTRYHFGKDVRRPFLYPIIGPSGRSLTRIGHPHDPHTHSHHNSVWVTHHNVNGVNFWGDYGKDLGVIVTRRPVRYEDSDTEALLEFEHAWNNEAGETQLEELRTIRIRPSQNGEYFIILDIVLSAPPGKPATLGKTPFGLVGVRMAKPSTFTMAAERFATRKAIATSLACIGSRPGGSTTRGPSCQTSMKASR